MNRRAFLGAFLATPVALRFAPFQRPVASDLARAGYFLFMSPMTAGQLEYDELDIALGLAPKSLDSRYSKRARESFAACKPEAYRGYRFV